MNFSFDQNADNALVADIGGTQMRAAIINTDGEALAREAIQTNQTDGLDSAVERLLKLMLAVAQGRRVAGACVSSAGPIDPATGTYSHPPSLMTWHNRSMKPFLERNLGMPVHFGHDATLAALAETTFGKFKGAQNFIYMTVSTGIGGGIISHGEMVTGANGFAGEVGHIIIKPDSALKCGGSCVGCLESLASGTGIVNLTKAALRGAVKSSLKDEFGPDLARLTTTAVFAHARAGDRAAAKVIKEAINNLAIGVGSLLNIFDPEAMTLGGGVTNEIKPYWNNLLADIKKYALPRFADGVPVSITELGENSCLLGAAALAFRKLNRAV